MRGSIECYLVLCDGATLNLGIVYLYIVYLWFYSRIHLHLYFFQCKALLTLPIAELYIV